MLGFLLNIWNGIGYGVRKAAAAAGPIAWTVGTSQVGGTDTIS